MTRILDRPVELRRDGGGRPAAFLWRRRWYRVAEVLDEWVYRRPWWEGGDGAAERTFYRVLAESGGVFELAVDPAGAASLYRAFD